MKIAFITDTHFGARGDSTIFDTFFKKFYDNVFFPYLEENNIKTIIHLGDVFDRRKYINYNTLASCREYFFNKVKDYDTHMIVGNHDVYFKNTNEVNSLELLLQEYNIKVYSQPDHITVGGRKILLLPWICADNYEQSMEIVEKSDATVCLGHLEIQGFQMYKGAESQGGLDKNLFEKFHTVCSGHYHHRSTGGNITYLGNPYEITWSDYNDPRGFNIFDTETYEIEHIVNPYNIFQKVFYDDKENVIQDAHDTFKSFKDTNVKIVIKNKDNPYTFDRFMNLIEKAGPANIQVVDDHLNLNLEDDDSVIDEAEDIRTILQKYIESSDMKTDKKSVYKLIDSVYNEALTVNSAN